jgi:hypothetical protein
MKNIIYLTFFGLIAFSFNSCYRDNEEELYRFSDSNCDTSVVNYTTTITSVLSTNCLGCHSGASAAGNPQVFLDNYNGVKTVAANGKLLNAVEYKTAKPMPPGAQMNYCNIAKIRIWVNNGSPNN